MKANCSTCRHNNTPICPLISATLAHEIVWADVVNWRLAQQPMTPDADGCPGYESAAPLMGRPEDYSADTRVARSLAVARDTIAAFEAMAQHIAANAPRIAQDRAQPAARIETEADAFEPACVRWDADDEGRDCG